MFPYLNNDTLLQVQDLPAVGTYYADNALQIIPSNYYSITGNNVLSNNNLEIHAYDLLGNRITGTQHATNWSYVQTSSIDNHAFDISVNLGAELNSLGLLRGQYYTVINLQKPFVGNYDNPGFYIKTISPSRTELRLSPIDSTSISYLAQYANLYVEYTSIAEFAINDANRLYDDYNNGDIILGIPQNSNIQSAQYYFDDDTVRLAWDQYITNLVNNTTFYNGTTFIAPQAGTYDLYIGLTQKAILLTALWFKGANIRMTPVTMQAFAPEINTYRTLYSQLSITELSALYDSINQVQEFWRRNSDGTYKHIGQDYFNNNGVTGTLAKAGYSILPFVYPSDYILNFGNNNIAKVINIVFENITSPQRTILVKLANPLDILFQELDVLWLAAEITQPLIEKILLVNILQAITGNTLLGPNFNIDVEEAQSIATSLQSWNDLLAANISTNQQIVDRYFSGSLEGIHLNINYGEFKNFVHFSSAEERVANFQYKLQMIEYYTDRLDMLSHTTGSIGANLVEAETKRNTIIGGFDDFEKYLFYDTTGSLLYTFASCSIQPWPKQNITNNLVTYANQIPTTSSIAIAYYNDLIEQAQIFDRFNIHALRNTIPGHIQNDQFNEEYILFVDMIGHYYDIIWSYINQLTQINSREEHPFDGMAQDLIYYVAKSLGVNVYNGKSTKDLWSYALGVDSNGEYIQTGSLQSLSQEQTTQEVWRRVVNNLPYLYKTKGTARSIKALLTCYGIPTTILNIKEYGGVNPEQNDLFPYYVHDVYAYAYEATGSNTNYVLTPWQNFEKVDEAQSSSYQYPDAIEFRFRTDDNYTYDIGKEYSLVRGDLDTPVTGSIWSQIQSTWSQFPYLWSTGGNTLVPNTGDPFFEITFKRVSEHSGSLNFYLSGSNGFVSASIDNLYMFDNNWITAVVQRNISTDTITETSQSFTLKYQKGLYGKIVASGSSTIDLSSNPNSGSYNNSWTSGSYLMFGRGAQNTGIAGNTSYKFFGFYQELRYWYNVLSDSSISNHTLSPSSYNGNTAFSTYYDLVFRTSLSRKDVITNSNFGYLQQLSHHPNQRINTKASSIFVDRFTGDTVPFESVEETYYTLYADLTAHVISSEKIRIESQSLSEPLSSDRRVTKSSFDKNSLDSNKLGIYFSPQQGINEDIVNHLGYLSLDDYIGDPRDQYEPTYRHLNILQDEYWKKYKNKNDFEAFFRALQIYDLSVFRQIKKFVPARANLITGIVVEPNLLERNKARYVRKPTVENLVINGNIALSNGSGSLNGTYVNTPIGVLNNAGGIFTGSYVNLYTGVIPSNALNNTPYTIGTYNTNTNTNNFPYIVLDTLTNNDQYDIWYQGTQSTSANINAPSNDTIDLGPVVVVTVNGSPAILAQNGINTNLIVH